MAQLLSGTAHLSVASAYKYPALSDSEASDSEPQIPTARSSRSSRSAFDNAPSVPSDDEVEAETQPVTANGGSEVDEDDDEDDEDLEEDVYAQLAAATLATRFSY